MSTLLVLAIVALVVFGAFRAWRRYILAQIEADRRAELARAARARHRAEAQINQMAAYAIHHMVEVADRSHVDWRSSR